MAKESNEESKQEKIARGGINLGAFESLITHAICILIYMKPILEEYPSYEAVLDEIHTTSNGDVLGNTSIKEVFQNDYWGRNMYLPSSHKSWRPLTILSFRFLNSTNLEGIDPVLMQRFVNVIIHACLAEMVSVLALQLFPTVTNAKSGMGIRSLTKLLFAFHPCHVEAVANGANRPHILALVFSLLMVDDRTNILILLFGAVASLLTSETAIFQFPAVMATMTIVKWKRTVHKKKTFLSFLTTVTSLLPRIVLIASLGATYLGLRYALDTLSIPEGLIRPAENPFFAFTGLKRFLSYSIILSAHVGKAFLVDPIGFSHEYGHECVRAVESLGDKRLLIPLGIILGSLQLFVLTLSHKTKRVEYTLHLLLVYAWLLTLFPMTGIIKIGTFIADRLVVASTVPFALFLARALSSDTKTTFVRIPVVRYALTLGILYHMSRKVLYRTLQWTRSDLLLESSLVTCPRSAKSHLEISKLYSGMMSKGMRSHPTDMDVALNHLEVAESIDPTYCDVHQQFMGIHFQKQEFIPQFEYRLTRAVMCPFTMEGASKTFRQYWAAVTADPRSGKQAKKRYEKVMEVIKEEMEKAEKEEAKKAGRVQGPQYDEVIVEEF